MKNVNRRKASAGLSIPPVSGTAKFRTKDKTLVATGYEKDMGASLYY